MVRLLQIGEGYPSGGPIEEHHGAPLAPSRPFCTSATHFGRGAPRLLVRNAEVFFLTVIL